MKKQFYVIAFVVILIGVILVFLSVQKPLNMPSDVIYLSEAQCKQLGYDWVHRPGLCMPAKLDESKIMMIGIAPTLAIAYLVIGALLYLASMKFGKRVNLRFWGKSIFVAGIFGLFLAFLAPMVVNALGGW